MSQFSISNFLTSLTTFSLAIFVFFYNRKSRINKFFCFYSLSISIWSFLTALHALTTSSAVSFLCAKIMHFAVALIPILFLHFCIEILEFYKKYKNILFLGYFSSFLFIIANFTTDLIVRGVRPKIGYHYFMYGGYLYPFLILYFFIYASLGLYLLRKEVYISTGNRRNQLKYLFYGSLLGYAFGSSCFMPVYDITLLPYPFGSYGISLYVIITTYAILKYRLMDIKIALSRAVIFVIVYTLVLGIPFWLGFKFLGKGLWIIPVSVTAFLATLGPFIYLYLNRRAENRLLKEQRHYQNILKQASVGMTRIRNLKRLLDLIVHIVTKSVKISYAGIYLYNKDSEEYLLQVARDKGRIPVFKLPFDNPLIAWIRLKHNPLIYEEIRHKALDTNDSAYRRLEENMRFLSASVVIPSLLEDRLMGFLVLGEKISGDIYTPEDINVFEVLASQAALAIENAQFYEETKEMQERIATAEKMATIGTMADGLSHQINNRFYALSLIAADTIDTIKITDTSKCTTEVKEMLNQINHALERIEDNVVKGGQVVRGILKYTRKVDEGFEALRLDQVLDSSLDMLQYKIKLSEIDILRDFSKDIPMIKGNAVQLQEVFFNIIDNDYDAIVERSTILQEEGYRGKITISAYPKQSNLEIIVEDNGIGMKEENIKKVFTPFFTTKSSSHKGTGLGLYVIRKIITDTHKGKITFESSYKVGTKFILELPIAT